jgi:hypothetical protein
MIPTTFASYIRKKTKTNATTFTDADMVMYANVFKDEIAERIIQKNEHYFGMYSLATLVAGQREYSLPDDLLSKIMFVEAKLDGSNWSRLKEVNINTDDFVMDEASVRNEFSGRDPGYFIIRKSLYLLTGSAIIDVSDGLRLWSLSYPAEFTTFASGSNDMSVAPSSTGHGWPRPFQELLARRIIIEWKSSQDKPIPLSEREQMYENDLNEALESISDMNLDRSLVATMPHDDGSNY